MTIIGITMGCPVGIGPEIILRYLESKEQLQAVHPIILGDIGVLEKCAQELKITHTFRQWQPGTKIFPDATPVVPITSLDINALQWGKPDKDTGEAMANYILSGIDLTKRGFLDGIATCPISKDWLNEAGFDFPGHTEMLAELTGSDNFAMMMAGGKLKVTLVTIHCQLAKVPALLTRQKVFDLITTTDLALRNDFSLQTPHIAVAGLNPHGGENQLFGNEELQIIGPAIKQAQDKQIKVSGPYPPDTVFYKAAGGEFDAVVCMYHDQGLIPFKLLHFEDGVNVTLGLPIVRTSVDHGTAYDIAGKGKASYQSLQQAIKLAADISNNRKTKLKHEKDGP